ncbi:hypothetical protein BC835DRAFT_1330339 [Cytidiella melzeri]|nr:hypothetical protein BC835DRAFT_1330339 [Cytidiella melzeri]
MPKSEGTTQDDFDFWEFVTCACCYLKFAPEDTSRSSVPFWLTECGHVLCNNHLKTDQSCAKCGQRDIQVSALQYQMDQPMAAWFTAAPQTMYATAFAATFQYNQLASLVRHYKHRCSQHRLLIENLRASVQDQTALQRTIEELQEENQRLREYIGEPSEITNANGKRRMQEFHRHTSGARTNSSPRTVVTPVGPGRLTLPPSHQQPNFPDTQHHSDDGRQVGRQSRAVEYMSSSNRPGSRQFSEQYAYVPPTAIETPAVPAVSLAHSQTHAVRQAQVRRQHNKNHPHTSMLPPDQQNGKFKPGAILTTDMLSRKRDASGRAAEMPPPNLPRAGFVRQGKPVSAVPQGLNTVSSRHRFVSAAADDDNEHSFAYSRMSTPLPELLPTQRFTPSNSSRNQRLVASNSTTATVSRAGPSYVDPKAGSGSHAPSRTPTGQRMPFVPNGSSRGFA